MGMRYFAYGSNMNSHRLIARVDEAAVIGPARLPDHALHCDKDGGDGSAKFTIAASSGAMVHGVLFELPDSAREILDGFEGPGYQAREVLLLTPRGEYSALTYQALDEWRDNSLLPFDWYVAYATAGATQHQLPQSWVRTLQGWPSQPDPIPRRATLNRRILNGALPELAEQREWPC